MVKIAKIRHTQNTPKSTVSFYYMLKYADIFPETVPKNLSQHFALHRNINWFTPTLKRK